jgi:hypothetical protein
MAPPVGTAAMRGNPDEAAGGPELLDEEVEEPLDCNLLIE